MSERNNDEIPNVVGPKSAVFKSADHGPTKMNSMTNSAVSDVAVERVAEVLGGIIQVGSVGIVAVTLLFPALLAGTASVVAAAALRAGQRS